MWPVLSVGSRSQPQTWHDTVKEVLNTTSRLTTGPGTTVPTGSKHAAYHLRSMFKALSMGLRLTSSPQWVSRLSTHPSSPLTMRLSWLQCALITIVLQHKAC